MFDVMKHHLMTCLNVVWETIKLKHVIFTLLFHVTFYFFLSLCFSNTRHFLSYLAIAKLIFGPPKCSNLADVTMHRWEADGRAGFHCFTKQITNKLNKHNKDFRDTKKDLNKSCHGHEDFCFWWPNNAF